MTQDQYTNKAFTVVELIVVVGVISILAVISIVSYGSWQRQTIDNSVKANLVAAAGAMESARNAEDGFPGTLPDSFTPSSGVTVTIFNVTDKSFCLDGSATGSPSTYYIESATKNDGAQSGSCSASPNSPLPLAPQNISFVSKNDTEVQITWSALVAPAPASYTVQCATDPVFITAKKETTVAHPATSANFTGLSALSTYFCRVKATSGSGAGPWSAMINTDTNTAYGSLAVGTSVDGYWTTAPQGFLLEDGSTVSRTLYADLFAVIGTKYGIGDGSTTFKLPDSRGDATVSQDTRDSDFATIGQTLGHKTHTLTIPEMPSHTHIQNAHTHTQVAHSHNVTDPNHTHTQNSHNHTQNAHNHNSGYTNPSPFVSDGSFGSTLVQTASGGNYGFRYGATSNATATNNATTATNNSATTGITIGSATPTNNATTATNQNNGSGQAHNNIQPSYVKVSAIKYAPVDTNAVENPEGSSINGYWSSAPSGYLLEDGSEVSRTVYASLFAVIGTTYGAGNGTTTFKLPDSRGRLGVNLRTADTEFDTVGKISGTKTETIDIASMPSHTHTQNAHTHTQNSHTHSTTDPGHNHTQNSHNHTQNAHDHNAGNSNAYISDGSFGGSSVASAGGAAYGFRLGQHGSVTATNNATTATNQSSSTGVTLYDTTGVNNSTTAVNQSTGGDGAHNNLQPMIVKATAIKATPASSTEAEVAPGTSLSGYWNTAPAGYLVENGAAVSRTTYAALFAVIGTTFGGGNGTTTFNLPNSEGKVGVNRSPSDTEFDSLHESFGTKTVTLTTAQLPVHTHIQNSHTHTQNSHTHSIYDPGHTHTQNSHNHTQNAHGHSGHLTAGAFGGTSASSLAGGSYGFRLSNMPSVTATNIAATATNNANTTGISTGSATATNNSTTAVNQSTGGGNAHNNIAPSIVRLFVIKY